MRRFIASATGVLAFFSATAAWATTVGPGEVGGQTWTKANSPYVIEGDVTVATGTSLTIQPGVVVKFAAVDKAAAGANAKLVEIVVNGTGKIVANGTAADLITFEPETGNAKSSYYGINVAGINASADITFSKFTGAFLAVRALGGNLKLEDTQIVTSATGVAFATGTPSIKRLDAVGCTTGVRVDGGDPTISQSKFTGSTSAAISAEVNTNVTVNIVNTLIHGGQAGVYAKANALKLTVNITNSTLADGSGVGVEISNGGGATSVNVLNSIVSGWGTGGLVLDVVGGNALKASYTDVFGNKVNLTNVTSGEKVLSVDPLYVGNNNYTLTDKSTLINVGDPTGPKDDITGGVRPIGPGWDLGAYEYNGPGCGDGKPQTGETCDDGVKNGTYGFCKIDCSALGPHCGDKTVDKDNETCDDGNDKDGDGCSATCQTETDAGADAGPVDSGASPDSGSSSSSSSSSGSTTADAGNLGLDSGTVTAGEPEDDGCSVNTVGASSVGGLWLLGAVGALIVRRRRRQ